MAVVLALLSSLLWGFADFAGGTASRRHAALLVVLVSQATGLCAATIAALASGAFDAPLDYLPWAVGAGVSGGIGLLLFYRALAIGTMGVVSPIATLSVLVPVAVGIASGHWPAAVVGAGFVLTVLGVVAAGGPERSHGRSIRPVLLAIVAALCFGATLLFIARGAADAPLMTMVAMRCSSVLPLAVICLAMRRTVLGVTPPGPTGAAGARLTSSAGRSWLLMVVAGLFDVSANLAFAVASTGAALAVVAILGSLYPAVTVLMARWMFGERMTRLQQAGVAIALVGVALITGWS